MIEVVSVREKKLPLVVGIVDAVFFCLLCILSVYTGLKDNDLSTVILCGTIFGLFTLLGLYLILDYFRRRLVLYTGYLSYTPAVGKTRTYYYHEVAFICSRGERLLLYSHTGQKLLSIEINMRGWEEALFYFYEKGILVEERNVPLKLPVLKKLRLKSHREYIEKRWSEKRIAGERKMVRITGAVTALLCIVALFLLPVKGRLLVCILMMLLNYMLYLFLYPKVIMEERKKCDAWHIPLSFWPYIVGGGLLILFDTDLNIENEAYLLHSTYMMLGLLAPYLLTLLVKRIRESFFKCLLVAGALYLLAFAMAPSANYIATIDRPVHETVTVLEKESEFRSGSGTEYYFRILWQGREQKTGVPRGLYDSTAEGDEVTLCLRKSIFGMEYWLLHEKH